MKNGRFSFLLLALLFVCFGCRGPEGPTGPQGPPGSGLGSLSDPAVLPRVIYTYPPANSVGPYSDFYIPLGWIYYLDTWPGYPVSISQFQLRFNKYMDLTSVRRSVSLTSSAGDVLVDTNYVISVGGDVFLVNPIDTTGSRTEIWKIGETYTFSVASTARDINGNILSPPFSMTFLPEPYFRVKQTAPANGATNVSVVYPIIELLFNSPVDTSIRSSIHWNPPVDGIATIYGDASVVYFNLNKPLLGLTTYTMTMGTDAHDIAGNHLTQPFSYSFTTTGLRVSSTAPSDQATGVYPNTVVYVNLTLPIDTATVRSAFSITPPVNGVLNYGSDYFWFVPSPEFRLDTLYTVRIDTTLRALDGNRLPAPYVFKFRTAPFELSYTSPSSGQTGVSPQTSIYLSFNALIDSLTVPASCRLLDSAGTAVPLTYSYGSSSVFMIPLAGMKSFARYTVTISTALRSKQGAYLKKPVAFFFTTGN